MGPCTGQTSKTKAVTLTVLVGSLYCQNCVCAHFSSNVFATVLKRTDFTQHCTKELGSNNKK